MYYIMIILYKKCIKRVRILSIENQIDVSTNLRVV